MAVLSFNLLPYCHISFPYITCFDIKLIHQRIQTTPPHASRCHCCHYCNVDLVLFHNVPCYTNPLLSCIHVNTIYLLNITCILVATSMILGRLECIISSENICIPKSFFGSIGHPNTISIFMQYECWP